MKIGIATTRQPIQCLSSYEDRKDAIVVDMNLPDIVEAEINHIHNTFHDHHDEPLAYLDTGSHGHNSGLVLWNTLYDSPCLQQTSDGTIQLDNWTVKTRISIGPTDEYKKQNPTWNGEMSRLHIGVWAGRNCCFEAKPETRNQQFYTHSLHYVTEQINFSMRWLDGQFDDWSHIRLWRKDRTNKKKSFNLHEFNEFRTTYFDSRESSESILGPNKYAKRFMVILDDKPRLLPELETFGSVLEREKVIDEQELRCAYDLGHSGGTVPTVGYDEVIGILSNYSDKLTYINMDGYGKGTINSNDHKKIKKMSSEDGMKYTFHNVLDAMLRFARS